MYFLYIFFSCHSEDINYEQIADNDHDGVTLQDGDCDDLNPYIYPQALEICDSIDNNCDGFIDTNLDVLSSFYLDLDGDGFGATIEEMESCDLPQGYSFYGGDCNDQDPDVHPNIEVDWEYSFFNFDCDDVVQPYLKSSQANWGIYDMNSLLVVSDWTQENSTSNQVQQQLISISEQNLYLLNFPAEQYIVNQFQGITLQPFAIGTQNGNLAIFAKEQLGSDQGILLYDLESLRQPTNGISNFWNGSIGFLSLPQFELTDMQEVGDFLGLGNIIGILAHNNEFRYMLLYEELGDIILEEPSGWYQSMEWDQGNVVLSQQDLSYMGEKIWGLGDINGDGYDDVALQTTGSDIVHIIKGSFEPRFLYPFWTLQSEIGCDLSISSADFGDPIIFCNQDNQSFVYTDYHHGGSSDIMSANLQFSKKIDSIFRIDTQDAQFDLYHQYFAVLSNNQLLFHQRQEGVFQELQHVGYSFPTEIITEIFPISYNRELSGQDNLHEQISVVLGSTSNVYWLNSPFLE